MGRRPRLYKLYDNDEYVGTYTCKEVEKITGCKAEHVCVKARDMALYKNRYQVVAVNENGDPISYNWNFANRWNIARREVYKREGRIIWICCCCQKIIEGSHIQTQDKKHMHYECFKKKCEGE